MKLSWLPLALLFAPALCADTPASVKFEGVEYHLASAATAADGSTLNVFYKQNERSENWTTQLIVQHWPKATQLNDVVNPWLTGVRSQLAKKWTAQHTPKSAIESDVVLEAWLMQPGKPALEVTLARFVMEDDNGVKLYRLIEKVDPKSQEALDAFTSKRLARCEALGQLALPVSAENRAALATTVDTR